MSVLNSLPKNPRDWSWAEREDFRIETQRFHDTGQEVFGECPTEQKNWGNKQLISYEDLEPGAIYVDHGREGSMKVLCLGTPVRKYEIWIVKTTWWPKCERVYEMSLADRGLIPYSNGTFNPWGWLEVTNQKLTPAQLAAVQKRLFG